MHVANSDRPVSFYDLNVILAVGFRINLIEALFLDDRQASVLKQFMFNKQNCLECKEKIIDLQKQIYEIKDFQNKSLTLNVFIPFLCKWRY